MKRVAIVGIQGVPAQYGGFETLVENIIGKNCSSTVKYTIFCSSKDYVVKKNEYKSAALKYIPLHANGMQSFLYDIVGMLRTLWGYDTVLILGVSGCLFLPIYRLFYHKNLIINIDGLEHRRAKWGKFTKWILKKSCDCAVKWANVVISDNQGICDYVKDTYGIDSVLIAYGGDHVMRNISIKQQMIVLEKYHLQNKKYSITICRIEPENNSHVILQAFEESGKELVFVGNWNRSDYSRKLKQRYEKLPNIHLIESLYDLDELYALRNQCSFYLHGHSAGGTNPSLVEAMFFGKPILAFDVVYNRETTQGKANYFGDVEELKKLVGMDYSEQIRNGKAMKEIAQKVYVWANIAQQYESLYK
jgi:glycosyltransferase involved in cell wall biosynthesis